MKVVAQESEVFSRGEMNKTAYRVAQTGKVMDMFSNLLYSDKIKAVIRELSTNAWDAHVMAGTTDLTPEIYLPTYDNPEFRIRDFGTGLSPEQLESMYLTYGESNKSDSNEFNGCMGIGSKSPFAYTSAFTTTSFFNGMKYIYVNAKDEYGVPNLQLFHSEKTDEPNGLQISFVCSQNDFDAFGTKAQEVLKWFPKPFHAFYVDGHKSRPKTIIPEQKYSMEGNGWKLRERNIYGSHISSYAIMGYVEYPIEQKHFAGENKPGDRDNDWYRYYDESPFIKLLNLGLELHFDIGEIEMDISRESLQYTARTVKAIKKRLQTVLDEIKVKVEKEFTDCKSMWEASIVMSNLINGKLGSISQLIKASNIMFEGKPIVKSVRFDNSQYEVYEVISFSRQSSSKVRRANEIVAIQPSDSVSFYVADMERGNYSALEEMIMKNYSVGHTCLLLKPMPGKSADEVIETAVKYIGLLDDDIEKCSSIPRNPKDKRDSDRQKTHNVFAFLTDKGKYRSQGIHWQKMFWQKTEIDFSEGGIYVELNNWITIREDGRRVESKDLSEIIASCKAIGLRIPPIIGVKSSVVQKYKKSKKWQCFYDWAKAKTEKHIKDSDFCDKLSDLQSLGDFCGRYEVDKLRKLIDISTEKIQNPDNPIKKLLDKVDFLSKIKVDFSVNPSEVEKTCSLLGVQMPNVSTKSELDDLAKQVCKYEVLDLVDHWDMNSTDKANKVIRIINLVDCI